jgi:hypothetical protein
MCILLPSIFIWLVIGIAVWERNSPNQKVAADVKTALWTRYRGTDPKDGDRAVAYAERVVDRQINKLRGVLSFDALIMAFLSLERARIPAVQHHWDLPSWELLLLTVAILLLALSSCLCLRVFRVHWGATDAYEEFEKELTQIVQLVADRSAAVARAVSLSIIALIAAIICFGLVEFVSAPKLTCGPPCRMETAVATLRP